jgi:tetratricopeptide (TPR) repeat protein
MFGRKQRIIRQAEVNEKEGSFKSLQDAAHQRIKLRQFKKAGDDFILAAKRAERDDKYLNAALSFETAGRTYALGKLKEEAITAFDNSTKTYRRLAKYYEKKGFPRGAKEAESIARVVERKKHGLEAKLVILAIATIAGILYLLKKPNIMGNVVTELNNVGLSFLVNFIIIGVLGLICYAYLK